MAKIRKTATALLAALAFASAATVNGQPQGEIIISAFGDSLSAGYELPADQGFAPVLQSALRGLGYAATVHNASVSGDTSSDGAGRVEWMLRKKPNIVIVELGANDMLRGLPTRLLRANLKYIIEKILASGAKVVLAGMRAPVNHGEQYAARFEAVYADLAAEYDLAFYPFFLEGVALNPELNLSDGSHPNPAGVRVIVNGILPTIIKTIKTI